ncbi:hypothetical protein Klosneuvirus_3_278 [Klosneuvirus KNV1]|uniref:Uncharacterized protein n=1 Tax=Klosneuvirus KNV1 TaxID=1977640 RepID=A0A1V0SKB0_9VIRU|nr:hypothetical protein Klosneuvirus_3_278 [Klosneuvirus KNV1]
MNFSIQPEFFYTNKERIQIMIIYKENNFFQSKLCSRWSPLHGLIEFKEFYDTQIKLPNIYNILGITIQLKYDGDYFIYYFRNQNNEPLMNIGKDNQISIFLDFYPKIVINNIIIPYDCQLFTYQQELDIEDDECVIL